MSKRKNKSLIEGPIGNYYGGTAVGIKNRRYYYGIENWDGWNWAQCSKAFYQAYKKEWAKAETIENPVPKIRKNAVSTRRIR